MKNSELLQEQSAQEPTANSSQSNLENTEFKNQQIDNTPVIARESNGRWFGTVGKYKVTNDYESLQDLRDGLKRRKIEWKDLMYISAAQDDYVQARLTDLQNQINKLTK